MDYEGTEVALWARLDGEHNSDIATLEQLFTSNMIYLLHCGYLLALSC